MNMLQVTTDIERYSNGLIIYEKNGQLIAEFHNYNNLNKGKFMSRKVCNLVSACIGGAEAIAVALVTYFTPEHATAINTSICVACTAAIEICNQFISER